jgi:integrase
MTDMPLRDLMELWEVRLKAERKARGTIGVYLLGVRQYLDWCASYDLPEEINLDQVAGWIAERLDDGAEAHTMIARQLAVRRFSAWLKDKGQQDRDPLLGMKPVKLDQKVVDPLSPGELVALLKACQGRDFRDRRDEAIVRVMAETGARAGEVCAMTVADTRIRDGEVVIRRGKGGKGRRVAIGPQTCDAIGSYLLVRRRHRLADSDWLWLGIPGKRFRYSALLVALKGRAAEAGIENFYPHRLRHTMADRWLDAGGSESGLMAQAGWSRPEMLLRYTKARREARAMDEARKLGLGDL